MIIQKQIYIQLDPEDTESGMVFTFETAAILYEILHKLFAPGGELADCPRINLPSMGIGALDQERDGSDVPMHVPPFGFQPMVRNRTE